MKLYEISNQIRDLALFEDNEQTSLALQELTDDFSVKALNIAKLTKELNADIEAIDNELKRLNDRKKSLQGKIEWFKNYLLTNMETSNIPQIKDSIITISVRKNPVSCEILDIDKVPEPYRKPNPELWIIDKTEAINYFKKTGAEIDGLKFNATNKHVEIK